MSCNEHIFTVRERAEDVIAREEKRYRDGVESAAELVARRGARFVFMAGPSCSGKTTTSFSLIKALRAKGLKVFTFSTDDFFFNEEDADHFEDGTPDYDAFSHTDSAYIRRVLGDLAAGKKTVLPTFDFLRGRRGEETLTVDPAKCDVFILEGIHALNDAILSALPETEKRVCLYLNTTGGVRMEAEPTGFSPEEVRFCRRLIRDYKHRGADAVRSFSLWVHVLESEAVILTPFRKNADIVLSTDFSYEPAVAQNEVSGRLAEVPPDSPWYRQAQALLRKYDAFPTLGEELVPRDSVLQEFLAD